MELIDKIAKYKEQINSIKEETIKRILGIVNDCGGSLFIADIDDIGDSPVLCYLETDGYNGAYSLDQITTDKSGNVLYFDGSSECDNCCFRDIDLSCEVLLDTLTFLLEHEEEIKELAQSL